MLQRDSVAVALFDVAGACFSSQRAHFILFLIPAGVNPVLLTIQTALSDWSGLILNRLCLTFSQTLFLSAASGQSSQIFVLL